MYTHVFFSGSLTLGMLAQQGLQYLVCVSACVSDALFLRHNKLIHFKEGTCSQKKFIRTDFPINASFKSYGIISLP